LEQKPFSQGIKIQPLAAAPEIKTGHSHFFNAKKEPL
jgi:hypothetical protein